jgi:hypothetical protein
LRRRAGADAIEMDTRAGSVRYTLSAPRELDFEQLLDLCEGAGFTIVDLDLETSGELRARGDGEGLELVVAATGQVLAFRGDAQAGETRVHGRVVDWGGDTPVLVGHTSPCAD